MRELVRKIIADKGLAMSTLSKAMGRNHAYLQQYLDEEDPRPRYLNEIMRGRLAPLLGVDESDLRDPIVQSVYPVTNVRSKPATQAGTILQGPTNEKTKVLGWAEGGPDGWALWNGDVVDTIDTPPKLKGVPGAYALYVLGSSMEPRYYEGELVHVHPSKPVTAGCFVIVQIKPEHEGETPRAVLKRLLKRTPTKIVLEQFNPAKKFDIQNEDIVSIHRIVGSADG